MRIFFALGIAFILTRCANVVPPTGGPKDTIPPTLIRSIPENQQIKFKGSQVELTFDEAVTLKNPKEEIIITPNTGKETQFIARKNTVIIKPPKEFENDITYSMAFRQAVVDLNEGNPTEDIRLAFSTGNYIDSLKIFGRVQRWPEDVPADKITVALYQSDTFNILKSQPNIFTRTDKKGRFSITNLKPGKYLIYVFEDKNKNLRADTQSEHVGFLLDTINTATHKDSIRIYATRLDVRPLRINSYKNISNYGIVRTNKNLNSYKLTEVKTGRRIVSQFGATQNEILYYPTTEGKDSTKVKLSVLDSAGYQTDSVFHIKKTSQKPIKEAFKLTTGPTISYEGEQQTKILIETNLPIRTQQSDSLLILLDTIPLFKRKFEARYDTIYKRLEITTALQLPDTLKKNEISATITKGTFYSLFNDSSKSINIKLPLRKQATLARLIVESTRANNNILIQALNDKGEVLQQEPLRKKNLFRNLPPENIQLRAVFDSNQNNKWDAGHIIKRRPPERVAYYLNENRERRIPLRANWELTVTWTPE